MKEYGPPPDWEAVFHRARRRMYGRLLLVAVLAAVGAGLLLNGGLAAQGAAPWLPFNKESKGKPKQDDGEQQDGPHRRRRQHQGHGHGHGHPDHKGKHGKQKRKQVGQMKDKDHKQWNPCGGDSAGAQYCDSPPSGPTGSTGATGSTDDAAGTSEVTATGRAAAPPED